MQDRDSHLDCYRTRCYVVGIKIHNMNIRIIYSGLPFQRVNIMPLSGCLQLITPSDWTAAVLQEYWHKSNYLTVFLINKGNCWLIKHKWKKFIKSHFSLVSKMFRIFPHQESLVNVAIMSEEPGSILIKNCDFFLIVRLNWAMTFPHLSHGASEWISDKGVSGQNNATL